MIRWPADLIEITFYLPVKALEVVGKILVAVGKGCLYIVEEYRKWMWTL